MQIYKNVLDEQTACLLLYGEIGDDDDDGKLSSRDVVEQLLELDGQYARLQVRVNSVGGEVYPGIAIFNALRQCKSEVTIYVDGIAASIAGVIALCGRRVEMSQYARLMLHSVSGGCYGNRNDLLQMAADIEKLEDMIAGIIAGRCGRRKEDVKADYFDGKDHWISASEAVAMGMADAIYDVPETVPDGATTDDIYRNFMNRLDSQPQNDKNMKLEELKKIPRFANCASEEEALKTARETAERADALEQENAALKEEAERLRKAAEEEQEHRIADTVEAAVADGRINAAQKETYTNILRADFASGQAALKALRPKRMVRNELQESTEPSDKGTWEKRQEAIRNRYDRML